MRITMMSISLLQIVCFTLISTMQLIQVQSEGSKERFDAILAQFGFSGIPVQAKSFASTLPKKLSTSLEREGENVIPDGRVYQVEDKFYSFAAKRKMIPIKSIHKKVKSQGGPFTIHPGTGVKVPNPQLLNERIRNPIFKSRYPRRRNIK